jgi:putative glutamine transport system substrate-binding protein
MIREVRRIATAVVAAVLIMMIFAGCSHNTEQITPEIIKDRGTLIVGVKEDVPYFSYYDSETGEFTGFEIEIARLIAEDLLGSSDKIEFIPVTTRTRSVLIEHGEIDLAIATFTANSDRREDFNFSGSYYTDYAGLLVREDSNFRDLLDLEGKTIGVLQSSTASKAVSSEAQALGISVKTITYASYADIQTALSAGRCDAFCADRAILRGYVAPDLKLTPDEFAPQEYCVGTHITNTELAAYIDELITKWKQDGTIDDLKVKYGI